MKKLSLLMALAMIITIGGVYANWTYNEGIIQDRPHGHFTVSMGEVTHATRKGELKLDTTGVKITFENLNGDYVPVMTITGSAYVYFKPAANPSEDVAAGLIDLRFVLTASTLGEEFDDVANTIKYQYEAEPAINVFSVYNESEQKVTIPAEPTLLTEGTNAGWYCYEITAAELAELIQFNDAAFRANGNAQALSSYAEFQAFQKVFNTYNLGISVYEYGSVAA